MALNSYFKHCPIKFTTPLDQKDGLSVLTQHCWNFLKNDLLNGELCPLIITCYCYGQYDGLFAKIGYTKLQIEYIRDEFRILSHLQKYDFVPKIKFVKEINENEPEDSDVPKHYYILFTEKINAISLDMIDQSDRRWKIGISGALDLLYKLYIETGFIHRDMHPNNIMIDKDDKVYIIDFERCYLPGDTRKSNWVSELSVFNESIEIRDDETFEKLEKWQRSLKLCEENFLKKIKEYKEIMFPNDLGFKELN